MTQDEHNFEPCMIHDRQYIITVSDSVSNGTNSLFDSAFQADAPKYSIREISNDSQYLEYLHREFERQCLIKPISNDLLEPSEPNEEECDDVACISIDDTEVIRNSLLRRLYMTPPTEFGDYNGNLKTNGGNNNRCDTTSTQTIMQLQDRSVHASVVSSSTSTQTSTRPSSQLLPDIILSDDELHDIPENEKAFTTFNDISPPRSVVSSESISKPTSSPEVSTTQHFKNPSNNLSIIGTSEIIKYLHTPHKTECTTYEYLPNNLLFNNQYPVSCSNSVGSGSIKMNLAYELKRTYEMKMNDEIIQSHFTRSDRRLKAIANRIRCKLQIIGPYNPQGESNYLTKSEWFSITIHSSSKVRLEKAVNCLSISFPNSNFAQKPTKEQPNKPTNTF